MRVRWSSQHDVLLQRQQLLFQLCPDSHGRCQSTWQNKPCAGDAACNLATVGGSASNRKWHVRNLWHFQASDATKCLYIQMPSSTAPHESCFRILARPGLAPSLHETYTDSCLRSLRAARGTQPPPSWSHCEEEPFCRA